jgi:hypothetical protein
VEVMGGFACRGRPPRTDIFPATARMDVGGRSGDG